MSDRVSEEPRKGWVRIALLVAFTAGGLAGFTIHAGLTDGWGTQVYAISGTAVLLVIVSFLVAQRAFPSRGSHIPLPGDVYGDREAPDPREPHGSQLDGRVPFNASKGVVKREMDPKVAKLQQQLTALNQQLQRANVKLGLGELSSEGYQRIVADIKEKRAEVEHRISQQEGASAGTR